MSKYTAYTGGSTRGKNGAAAYIIVQDGKIIHENSKKYTNTTCNRVEMIAAITAVCYVPDKSELEICTCSQYIINTFQRDSRPFTNGDLYDLYRKASENKTVSFRWIKRSDGDLLQTYVKELSSEQRKSVSDKFINYGAKPSDIKSYIAYTDGSADNTGTKMGGAAYIILKDGEIVHKACKKFKDTTSNRMEMLAIISAVNYVPKWSEIEIFTDSKYSANVFSGEWVPSKNLDLVEKFREVSKNKRVKITWIKGHDGNPYNEMVDRMASYI